MGHKCSSKAMGCLSRSATSKLLEFKPKMPENRHWPWHAHLCFFFFSFFLSKLLESKLLVLTSYHMPPHMMIIDKSWFKLNDILRKIINIIFKKYLRNIFLLLFIYFWYMESWVIYLFLLKVNKLNENNFHFIKHIDKYILLVLKIFY